MNANEQIISWLLQRIDEVLPHVSSSRILDELQIAIERISFIATADTSGNLVDTFPTLSDLFEGQVSIELTRLLQALVDQNYARLLIGPQGRATLAYCAKYYEQKPEIVFATAIEMSGETKQEVLKMIRVKHPEPQRIVFRVIPSLIAGFMIFNKNSSIDFSLRSAMDNKIPEYVKRNLFVRTNGAKNGS